jgi:hypothetical protein
MTNIASRKNTRHGRSHTKIRYDLSAFVQWDKSAQELRIGIQPEKRKDAGRVELQPLASFDIF